MTTLSILAAVFILPAACVLLVFWGVWRLVRLAGLPLCIRRILFIVLGTLSFAPMFQQNAALLPAVMPNAIFLLGILFDGPAPYFDQLLADLPFAITSFFMTAVLFALIAWRKLQPDVDLTPSDD
ncbi:MAG: hypothetical protein OXQ29_05880 [Rhodospirillaceae bacterium]|nr:hypothetical protein [Rhodospirillaceae bacterium]